MDTTDPAAPPPDLTNIEEVVDRLAEAPAADAPALADEAADLLERALEPRADREDPS